MISDLLHYQSDTWIYYIINLILGSDAIYYVINLMLVGYLYPTALTTNIHPSLQLIHHSDPTTKS